MKDRIRFEREIRELGLERPEDEIDELKEKENGGSRGPQISLAWKEKKKGNRVDIGLEVGGDDNKNLGTSMPGRVKLFEVNGTGKTAGKAEPAQERLIATFHGTFHRNSKAPADKRITFELFGVAKAVTPHSAEVLGYDPECILGVDALVVTFVNREFVIAYPFFVDTLSEGDFLEFRAVAEIDKDKTPVELGRSAIYKLKSRSTHEVETTTKDGGKALRYKGSLAGHQILHHEDYIVSGGSYAASTTPTTIPPQLIRIPPAGKAGFTFEKYVDGSFQIVLMNDLLDDLVPDAKELDRLISVPKGATSKVTPKWIRDVLRGEVSIRLLDLFLDAGFTGVSAIWDSDSAANRLVTAFKAAFSHKGSGVARVWELKRATTPLDIPFWTFFVVFDNVNVPPHLGLAENMDIRHQITAGGKIFRLPYPIPIGSGRKWLQAPIRIASGQLTNHLTTEDESVMRAPKSVPRTMVKTLVDLVAAQLANVIAHEVAHSLGLMHDVGIQISGPYKEQGADSSWSIMASSAEESAPAAEALFSNQAKVIWQIAFGVQPKFNPLALRNKTWAGDEWRTVEWSERMERMRKKYQSAKIARPYYLMTPIGQVPPFALKPPKVQKGTHL